MPEIRLILIIIGVLVILGVYLWGRRRSPEQQAMEEDWLEELARRKREGISPTRKTVPAKSAKRIEPGLGQSPAPAGKPVTEDLPPMPTAKPAAPAANQPKASAAPTRPEAANKPAAAAQSKSPRRPQKKQGNAEPPKKAEEMILVLFIMAPRGKQLEGMDIVAAAKQVNLQLGEMNVFNLFDDPQNKQNPIFTMASMMEPGTFDMDHLETFATPGLALFSQLPTVISGSAAFEKMLAVGRHMAQALNAELKDESRSTLTLQTIGHIREKVKNFDFRQQQGSAH
jgi:cell division protein ZipA